MIYVEVIPHKSQRYETVGDWQFLGENLHVSVSDSGNIRTNMLVAIHEIVEAFLCRETGIDQSDVDAFDMTHLDAAEPGELPEAPYHRQHAIAEIVERILAHEIGLPWVEHSAKVEAIG